MATAFLKLQEILKNKQTSKPAYTQEKVQSAFNIYIYVFQNIYTCKGTLCFICVKLLLHFFSV